MMTQKEMETYNLFKMAILRTDPSFDDETECAWQHWTTVREAWMKTRWGTTSNEMMLWALYKPQKFDELKK